MRVSNNFDFNDYGHSSENRSIAAIVIIQLIPTNLTKLKMFYSLGRDELITEHALAWNRRKICAMVTSLGKRFTRLLL